MRKKMNQPKGAHASNTPKQTNSKKDEAVLFSFDAPESIARSSLFDYLESGLLAGKPYYSPPVSYDMLSRAYGASTYHSSPIQVKRNILTNLFKPSKRLSGRDFLAAVFDLLVFGNAYFEIVNGSMGAWVLKHLPAKYMRRGEDLTQYFFLNHAKSNLDTPTEFKRGSVVHLMQVDFNQEVYGLPEYLSALSSAWLNESATLFRQQFYDNGAHAGSIIYMNDAVNDPSSVEKFKTELKKAKGRGNFKNMFMYVPGGKKDGIQVIPLSEATAKDEFFNIKNVTRDDLLAAHRVHPVNLSIIPTNAGGYGDIEKIISVFGFVEIEPLITLLSYVNEVLDEQVMQFKPYAAGSQHQPPSVSVV